ncbi:serine/threonine-protein kinase [Streptomyces sp. DT2A-34]|uniref:serine/threonine-protein kinase n=1 Tax=Streptomyces sp. DT2A-34 TaxID=3051182 RepID=UPI00265C6887|nr:serine/threonine-protein kinase [Streptomyces sp. DT2A-34]MDO0910877.1 serine/threonine-protein kinase [Streptomyces sp. DT2A-34]
MNAPGDVVDGRFELVERLGSGGMGTVWRARDTVLHREVALKAVRSDPDTVGLVRERVLREARALARLSHPHVVTVHQIIDADPHPWIVMELVPGVSLQRRLDDGPLTPLEAARLGRQVLAALRAAHAAGIQHRDVKPANILLRPDGDAVLTDFGIAALQGTTALTATGELVGSPEYMAPERIRGHDDEPAADLWSLGVVLYVCVEGVSPLRRPTTLATLAAVLDAPLPAPTRSGPLTPVLDALLVRDPAARPDAARLDAMLAQVEAGATPQWARPTLTAGAPHHPTPAPPPIPTQLDTPRPTAPQQSRGPRRRTPLVVAASAALVIAAATALVFALRPDGGAKADDKAGGATTPAVTRSTAGPAPEQQSPSPTPSPTTPTPTPTGTPIGASEGRWIAQLHSEPIASGTAARDRRLAAVRRSVPEATVLRSDDYASLRPGYWVIHAPGPFTDGRAALAFCAEHGRTTANSCVGRYLSTDATDLTLQCRPPATAPTGSCTRPD